MKWLVPIGLSVVWACSAIGCAESSEPPRFQIPVKTQEGDLKTVTTNMGYHISLTDVRIAAFEITFAVGGEDHLAAEFSPLSWFVGRAMAHPGHSHAGDVAGELPGRFILDWKRPTTLGSGTFVTGIYTSTNFRFAHSRLEDGLEADDPMLGFAGHLEGIAERDGKSWPFSVIIDADEGRAVEGIPTSAQVTSSGPTDFAIRFELLDPLEGDTPFDDVDFESLADGQSGPLVFGPAAAGDIQQAWWRIRRAVQSHDHYSVVAQ